jgi:uncharacterized membrane protein (DUF4010 family)
MVHPSEAAMLPKLLNAIPPTVVQLLLVLVLSFLVGLEREALKREGKRTFGGVRTFPLLGLVGYTLAFLGNGQVLAIVLGFAVVGGFMLVSYWYKLRFSTEAGITTEISGLVVYLVGALLFQSHYWIACTLVVANLFLLELKESLEGLTDRIAPEEIIALTKFLLLSSVILPLVPNEDFTVFRINPYRTWLVVVAVSFVSYASYLLFKVAKGKGGVLLSAVLGGIYSSTITTVVLAKRASSEMRPYTYSGSILAASGMMYLRILVLVGLFNRELMVSLAPSFLGLAGAALAVGTFWSRRRHAEDQRGEGAAQSRNPLNLRAAFTFALIFLVMVVVTHLAVNYLGRYGVFTLAGIMGVTDVDPFIMGLTQATRTGATSVSIAAASIVLATASNNLVKGVYAYLFAKRLAGRWSLGLLTALALVGLLPLLWL